MFDKIKSLQSKQAKALIVFAKAQIQQEIVIDEINVEAEKVAKKIAEEQAREQELIVMKKSADKFLGKIKEFLE